MVTLAGLSPSPSSPAHPCSPATGGCRCFAKALQVEGPAAHTLEHHRLLAVRDKGSRQFLAWSPHPSSSLRLTGFPLGTSPNHFPKAGPCLPPPHPTLGKTLLPLSIHHPSLPQTTWLRP